MPAHAQPITFRKKTQSAYAWARETGIPENTIRSRLQAGKSIEEALSTPPDRRFKPVPREEPQPVPPAPKLGVSSDGRACARWTEAGKRRIAYFGAAGTAAANSAYARWCAEWYAHQGRPAPAPGETVSVAGIILRFDEWAERYYRKRGKITSEVHGFRAALAFANNLYGDTPAERFSPRELKAIQAKLVEEGKSLPTVNAYVNKICRCFSWAVGESLVAAAVANALRHVKPLAKGRSEAPIPDKVTAVPDADFSAALPHLHKDPKRRAVIETLLKVQRLTGMRPTEVCSLQPEQLDRKRTPWLYTPADAKTLHLDKDRRVWIGPKARKLLTPLLKTAEDGKPVFRIVGRNGKGLVGVSVKFLRKCIAEACEKAEVPVFKPNQVRHLRADDVHEKYEDDEAVASALGNTPEVARQVYIGRPADAVAKRIAEAMG